MGEGVVVAASSLRKAKPPPRAAGFEPANDAKLSSVALSARPRHPDFYIIILVYIIILSETREMYWFYPHVFFFFVQLHTILTRKIALMGTTWVFDLKENVV